MDLSPGRIILETFDEKDTLYHAVTHDRAKSGRDIDPYRDFMTHYDALMDRGNFRDPEPFGLPEELKEDMIDALVNLRTSYKSEQQYLRDHPEDFPFEPDDIVDPLERWISTAEAMLATLGITLPESED